LAPAKGWMRSIGIQGKVTLHVPLQNLSETSFYEDRFGVFWILPDHRRRVGGLRSKDEYAHSLFFHESHLSDALMTGAMTMLEDKDGTLWFGRLAMAWSKFDRQERKFIRYRNDPRPRIVSAKTMWLPCFRIAKETFGGLHMMAPNRFATQTAAL